MAEIPVICCLIRSGYWKINENYVSKRSQGVKNICRCHLPKLSAPAHALVPPGNHTSQPIETKALITCQHLENGMQTGYKTLAEWPFRKFGTWWHSACEFRGFRCWDNPNIVFLECYRCLYRWPSKDIDKPWWSRQVSLSPMKTLILYRCFISLHTINKKHCSGISYRGIISSFLSYLVISCHILSYLVISCHILSYLVIMHYSIPTKQSSTSPPVENPHVIIP